MPASYCVVMAGTLTALCQLVAVIGASFFLEAVVCPLGPGTAMVYPVYRYRTVSLTILCVMPSVLFSTLNDLISLTSTSETDALVEPW